MKRFTIPFLLGWAAALAFYWSIPNRNSPYDYTFRIAEAFLHGRLGLAANPGDWLNELVRVDGSYYSVFPLGSVLTMLPVAALKVLGWVREFPSRIVSALIAGMLVAAFLLLSYARESTLPRRIILALFPVFGAWTWCNLGFGGSWQITIALALLGQTLALYFCLVRPQPLLAGAAFALAFGNRTEVILSAPFYAYLLLRPSFAAMPACRWQNLWQPIWRNRGLLVRFCAIPFALGVLTLLYNQQRFGSFLDFGYLRIPQLKNEPYFDEGLFSLSAIPRNIHHMIFEGLREVHEFPYEAPFGFGGSIFLCCPLLFLIFRELDQPRDLKIVSWLALGVLTLALWTHANPGGWQFSYRYAIILLPWFFLLLLHNGPTRLRATEAVLFGASVAINAAGTYFFLWSPEGQF